MLSPCLHSCWNIRKKEKTDTGQTKLDGKSLSSSWLSCKIRKIKHENFVDVTKYTQKHKSYPEHGSDIFFLSTRLKNTLLKIQWVPTVNHFLVNLSSAATVGADTAESAVQIIKYLVLKVNIIILWRIRKMQLLILCDRPAQNLTRRPVLVLREFYWTFDFVNWIYYGLS